MSGLKLSDGLGLGRLRSEDPRDKSYPMSTLVDLGAPAPSNRYWWADGYWGDQGNKPSCVGYAWCHWLEDGPTTQKPYKRGTDPIVDPYKLYKDSQKVDEWPGEDYAGTSVRAGAKMLQEHGYITGYYWAWNLDMMVQAVLTTGPVVVGTWWYESMFLPNDEGFLEVRGRIMGGHAYVVNGVNVKQEKVRIKNSWGKNWAKDGYAWITFKDIERLINEEGEICLAAERDPNRP